MKNLGAKVLLVEPAFVETALEAAAQANLPRSHIFQFSDAEAPVPARFGVVDWRGMLGTPAQGDAYQWPRLTAQESKETVATINFSSVRVFFLCPCTVPVMARFDLMVELSALEWSIKGFPRHLDISS